MPAGGDHHSAVIGEKVTIPADDLNYTIPLGPARIARVGRDLMILTYSAMLHRSLEAVEALGVDAAIVDLRTLDWETIGASARKTHNVLIVEQGARHLLWCDAGR